MNARKKWMIWGGVAVAFFASILLATVMHVRKQPAPAAFDLSQYTQLTTSTSVNNSPAAQTDRKGPAPAGHLPEAHPPAAEMDADSTNAPSHQDQGELHAVFPDRLSQDEFPYQVIPFEARIVEFPIVLLDQHRLDLAPEIRMDPTMGLQDTDPLSALRANVYRIEKPSPPPGPRPEPPKPPRPPEESPSGL